MTKVGKIFAVLVLLMSLAVAFEILIWYKTSTPWAIAYKNARGLIEDAQKSSAAAYKDADTARAQAKAELDKAAASLKKLQDEVDALRAQLGDKDKQLADEKNKNTRLDAQVNGMQTEIAQRTKDVEQLRVALEKEQKDNLDLIKQKNEFLNAKTLAEIQRDGFKDKNFQLVKQIEELAKENAKLSLSRGATTTTAMKVSDKNPPAEKLDAQVRGMTDTGLIRISMGSDQGLARGHTLEAYRLNQTTQKYLGTVRVMTVTPTEAVCQPVGKLAAPIQVGDRVASRILGG